MTQNKQTNVSSSLPWAEHKLHSAPISMTVVYLSFSLALRTSHDFKLRFNG